MHKEAPKAYEIEALALQLDKPPFTARLLPQQS
jgi:hypothetical protein